jgi:hypothetical protein
MSHKILQYIKNNIPTRLLYLIRKAGLTKKSKNDHKLIYKHRDSIKEFEKALYQFTYVKSGFVEIFLKAYLSKSVKCVKILPMDIKENEPILLCLVKDDLERVKLQIEYHKKIGVRFFVYIDNMSKDGTFEWLKEQNDVSLFTIDDVYNSIKQRAWRRQVIDILGYDKWYLTLDSDELFIYPGIEKKNINNYIDFLKKQKINSVLSPMIDMYSKNKIFENEINANGIFETYCYFDTDTYKLKKKFSTYEVNGGPRMRLFSTGDNIFSCMLSKYPLIYHSKEILIGAHQNYPYKYNLKNKGAAAFLLHYKFLPSDNEKFKENTISEVYDSGSKEYKIYMKAFEQNPSLSFYYENSQKLNNSMDLMKINIIDKEFFSSFLNSI